MQKLTELMQLQFDKMCSTGMLFKSKLSGQQVQELYLKNFLPEDDPVFRDPNSSLHKCNLCNNFIRRYGNIIAIDDDYKIMTIWDVYPSEEYTASVNAIALSLKKYPVQDIFFETFGELNSLPYEI